MEVEREWLSVLQATGLHGSGIYTKARCEWCAVYWVKWWIYFCSLHYYALSVQFSSVAQLCRLFETPWTATRQASLSITNSLSLPKLMTIELVMPSNHLILCCPLLLLPSIFPNIRVFSSESALHMRWPEYWSFSFNISPSEEHPGLVSSRMDWLDLLAVQGTLKSLFQVQKHQFFGTQLSL